MSLLKNLQARGLVHQFTGKDLQELLDNAKACYIGLDATAQSIHAGYMIPILLAKILAEHGVEMIVLLGGGTTKIGDPTGKNAARTMLTQEQIHANEQSLMKAVKKFFPTAKIVNNITWLEKLSWMDYLTEVARYVSINALINNELFAERLKNQHPLSMMELNYPLLQGYDFLHLNREYGCNLQIGGSDQWNNILMGVDFIKRIENRTVYGLTCPLLLTNDGKKMGKTENGAVWLDENLFSPFDFWQYWRNISDTDCVKYSKLFLDTENIEDINKAKIRLATELTAWIHDEEAAAQALAKAEDLFEKKDTSSLEAVEFKNLTLAEIVYSLSWADSKANAKRLIEQGGITINNDKIIDPNYVFTGESILCKGKKIFAKVIN